MVSHASRSGIPPMSSRHSRRYSLRAPWMCESGIGMISQPCGVGSSRRPPRSPSRARLGTAEQRREPLRRQLDIAVELPMCVNSRQPAACSPRLNARASRAKAKRSGPSSVSPALITVTKGSRRSQARAIANVSSREPSSTIIHRSGGRSWAAIARAVRSRWSASLYTGLTMSRRSTSGDDIRADIGQLTGTEAPLLIARMAAP